MPAQLLYTQSGCLDQAATIRARMAGAKVRLWKAGLSLSWATSRAEMVAAECDFDGYLPGGIAVAAWTTPVLLPGQGAGITSGLQQFVFAAGGPGVGNIAGGFWVETADAVLILAGEFPEPVPMQIPGQAQPLTITLGFPSG